MLKAQDGGHAMRSRDARRGCEAPRPLARECCATGCGHNGVSLGTLKERYDSGAAGPYDLALMAALLGDWPVARHWLREACAQRPPFLGYVNVEPAMAPLLEDPGCRELLERHGFGIHR